MVKIAKTLYNESVLSRLNAASIPEKGKHIFLYKNHFWLCRLY